MRGIARGLSICFWLASIQALPGCNGSEQHEQEQEQSCTGAAPMCARGCGADVVGASRCEGGKWKCPEDMLPMSDCPPDTCFTALGFLCCDVSGNRATAVCPNGGSPTCPAGFTRASAQFGCPKPCGAKLCDMYEVCTYSDHACGAGATGFCALRPTDCPIKSQAVCGCDAQIHASECDALKSGVDIAEGCNVIGWFSCGTRLCQNGVEYCEKTSEGGETSVTCKPLLAGCGSTPSCACLTSEPCGAQCADAGDGAITLSCGA